jgi:hypothetical protein
MTYVVILVALFVAVDTLLLLKLVALLRHVAAQWADGFDIRQEGYANMPITGIVVGATGVFTETPTPAGSALQTGNVPAWTADDTTVSLVPSADGTSVSATVPSGHAPTSFNLTCSGVNSAGAAISTTVAVPILPPPVTPATGFDINQTS